MKKNEKKKSRSLNFPNMSPSLRENGHSWLCHKKILLLQKKCANVQESLPQKVPSEKGSTTQGEKKTKCVCDGFISKNA